MSPKHFKKISHLEPQILNKFSQLTTDTQKKHTDRRTNVNLKLAPPEVGQLKQNKNFNSFHTWFKMSATYAFSFFSNPSPHWHPVKTYKPNLFFPKIFWISLIFWLNPPILPSKFSEIAHIRRKYKFSVCMQNTKIFFPLSYFPY